LPRLIADSQQGAGLLLQKLLSGQNRVHPRQELFARASVRV